MDIGTSEIHHIHDLMDELYNSACITIEVQGCTVLLDIMLAS